MRAGFTLIEVMVALTLLGLIATLLASGTRLSLDISARGNSRAEEVRTKHLERGLLRSQLQGALPFHYWTETENKRVEHVAFEGEPDRIRFVSRDGITHGPGSLPRWVDLRSQEMPGGASKLVVEEQRILSPDNEPGDTIEARAEILTCNGVHFDYLDTTGEQPQWLPAWTGTERKAPLPFAVRIQCKAADAANLLIPLDYAEPARQGMVLQ
jgi:general secretion pathway protein J